MFHMRILPHAQGNFHHQFGRRSQAAPAIDLKAIRARSDKFRSRLQPLMGVGDDEFYAAQRSATELAQKLGPERLGFRRADVHAQHLPAAVGVDFHGDDRRQRDDAVISPRFHIGRVDLEVRPVAFDRPLEEGLHRLVDLFAQAADLALRDAAHAHSLDEIVHRAR